MDLTASPADGYIYIKIPKTIGTSPPDRNFFLTERGFFAGAGCAAAERDNSVGSRKKGKSLAAICPKGFGESPELAEPLKQEGYGRLQYNTSRETAITAAQWEAMAAAGERHLRRAAPSGNGIYELRVKKTPSKWPEPATVPATEF